MHLCRVANNRLITFQYFNFLKRMVSQGVYLLHVSHSVINFVPCDESKWRLVDKNSIFLISQAQAIPSVSVPALHQG